ncbi:hypothetical protein [Streptomyces sp. NBC_00154]|uniref:hypothetical protein n=1 Tax=Streptomyces sp. NBC_00154 TaxID=2975670 RepID=UPI00224F34D5|nr:hypothetical protein [Streptomyces sp. NBC_00154]MCX5316980.1 hypothetical protein [Streptomyces sp. NBC_00154]
MPRSPPDFDGLRAVCDRLGFLGCTSTPCRSPRAAPLPPSIGVAEDIANANSTACLAAHLAGQGTTGIAVDMGDSHGSLATITATKQLGPAGPLIHLGGTTRLIRVVRLPGVSQPRAIGCWPEPPADTHQPSRQTSMSQCQSLPRS